MDEVKEKVIQINQNMKDQSDKSRGNTENKYKCKMCEFKFTCLSHLNSHIKIKQENLMKKCSQCDYAFENDFKLEQHLIIVHKKEKHFKCRICHATFLVEWRLQKHMNMHKQSNLRTCHFYNNNNKFPFQENGCKFAHINAEKCKQSSNCS